MRAHLTAFVMRTRQEIQYRAAALGGVVTQVFFGLLYILLYKALYDSGGAQPTPLSEVVSYVWIQQAFFRLMFSADGALNDDIRSGNLCYQLVRPINAYAHWFARLTGARVSASLMRALPLLALAALLPAPYGLQAPASVSGLLFSLVGLALGALCMTAIDNIVYAINMRTLDPRGAANLITLSMLFFSGNIVPLTLFPDFWRAFMLSTPFAQVLDAPIRLYINGAQPLPVLLPQALWLVALVALGQWLWSVNFKRIVVQGG